MSAIPGSKANPIAIIAELERGIAPAELCSDLEISPRVLVQAISNAVLADDPGPTLVQVSPARPKLLKALVKETLVPLYPQATAARILGLSAGLLQIHDFWEESHHAAQLADDLGETAVSAYWHAIAHRREPDPGNAAYWFRRVGGSPILARLARAISEWPQADRSVVNRVLSGGLVDPIRMIEFCESAANNRSPETLARRLQSLEMQLLLAETLAACE